MSPTQPVILCVDDNAPGLTIRKVLLETFNFSVRLATSGALALQIAAQEHIDVVVLDYRMPEMDGAELAQRLKALYPTLIIVMLSGFPAEIPEHAKRYLDLLLAKGNHPKELVEQLRMLALPGQPKRVGNTDIVNRNQAHVASVKRFIKENQRRKA